MGYLADNKTLRKFISAAMLADERVARTDVARSWSQPQTFDAPAVFTEPQEFDGGIVANASSFVTDDSGTAERIMHEVLLGSDTDVYRRAYIDEVVTFAGDAYKALATSLPAGSRVLFVHTNWDTALVLSTATKIGIGTSGDPDNLLLTGSTVTKNTKNGGPITPVNYSSLQAIRVSAVDNSGAAAGTVTSGSARVRIIYEYASALPDAA